MKKVSCPMFLHDAPVEVPCFEENFDEAGIHFLPHEDFAFRDMGYLRVVFVWKDGSKNTAPYHVHSEVAGKIQKLLKVSNERI